MKDASMHLSNNHHMPQEESDIISIFKLSKDGLNSEFSFS